MMAEEAATGNNDNLDYWIGGVETEEGGEMVEWSSCGLNWLVGRGA